MLISNQTSYCLGNKMDTFQSNTAKVVKNVARKSTSNRPLKTINNKSVDRADNSVLLSKSNYKIVQSNSNCSVNNVENTRYNNQSCNPNVYNKSSDFPPTIPLSLPENVLEFSEEECDEIDGVFSISGSMMQYLKESQQSPTIPYDSDEALNPSGILNYPMKYDVPNYARNEFIPIFTEALSISDDSDMSENDDIEIFGCCGEIEDTDMEPVKPLITQNAFNEEFSLDKIPVKSSTINSKNAVIRVTEEVVGYDNKSATLTIINADELTSSENTSEAEWKIEFIAPLADVSCDILWDSQRPQSQPVEESPPKPKISKQSSQQSPVKTGNVKKYKKKTLTIGKKKCNETRNVLLNKVIDESIPNGKRTRGVRKNKPPKVVASPRPKRKRPFSNRLSKANLNLADDVSDHSDISMNNSSPTSDNNSLTRLNKTEREKSRNIDKKDLSKCEKKKKEINEGILLHVEAAKKTDIMRDGKLLKDKKDLLKDIDSTIDNNLPVEVDKKDFEIQQSLTEEILLDQALRLAHQRTSPRRRPLLTTSEAKELVNSLTSRNNNSKQLDGKKKSNSSESPEKQKQSSDEDSSESESDEEQPQNNKVVDEINKSVTSSNLKSHKKNRSRTKQINDIKKILKQMADKLDPHMGDLSKTFEDVLKNINTLGNLSSDGQSESEIQEEKLKSNALKKRKKSQSNSSESINTIKSQKQSENSTGQSESDEENHVGKSNPKKKRKISNSNVTSNSESTVAKGLPLKQSVINFSSADQSESDILEDKDIKSPSKRVTRGSIAKITSGKGPSTKEQLNTSDSETEDDSQDSSIVKSPPKRITRSNANANMKSTVRRPLRRRESVMNNLSNTDESGDDFHGNTKGKSINTKKTRNARLNISNEATTAKDKIAKNSVTKLNSAESESEFEVKKLKSKPKRKTKNTVSKLAEKTSTDKERSMVNLSNSDQSGSDTEGMKAKSFRKKKRKSISLDKESTNNDDLVPKDFLTQISSANHFESDTQESNVKPYPKKKTRKSKYNYDVDDDISTLETDLLSKESLLSMDDSEESVPVIIIKNKKKAFLRKRSPRISKSISNRDECEVTSTSDDIVVPDQIESNNDKQTELKISTSDDIVVPEINDKQTDVKPSTSDGVAAPETIHSTNDKQTEIKLISLDVSYGLDTLVIDENMGENQSILIEDGNQPFIVDDDKEEDINKLIIVEDKDANHPTVVEDRDANHPTILDDKVNKLTIIEEVNESSIVEEKGANQPTIVKDKGVKQPIIVEDMVAKQLNILENMDADQPIIEDKDAKQPTTIDDKVNQLTIIEEANQSSIVEEKGVKQPTIVEDKGAKQPTLVGDVAAKQPNILENLDADQPIKESNQPTKIEKMGVQKQTAIEAKDANQPTIIEDEDANQPIVIDNRGANQFTTTEDKNVSSSLAKSTVEEVSNSQSERSDCVASTEGSIVIEGSSHEPKSNDHHKPDNEDIIEIIDLDLDSSGNEAEEKEIEEIPIPFLDYSTEKVSPNNQVISATHNKNSNLTMITQSDVAESPKNIDTASISAPNNYPPITEANTTIAVERIKGDAQIGTENLQSSVGKTAEPSLENSVPPRTTSISCVTPNLMQVPSNLQVGLCSATNAETNPHHLSDPCVFPHPPSNAMAYSTGATQITTSIFTTSTLLQHISQQSLASHSINTSEVQPSNYLNQNQSNFQYPMQASSHYSPTFESSTGVKSIPTLAQEEPKPKPKVVDVPLSILARDPRLRRKSVRIFVNDVEFNAPIMPTAKNPAASDSRALVPFSNALVPSRDFGDSRTSVTSSTPVSSRVSEDSQALVPLSNAMVHSRFSRDSRASTILPSRVSVDSKALAVGSSAMVPSRFSGDSRANATKPSRILGDSIMSGDLRLFAASNALANSRIQASYGSSNVNKSCAANQIKEIAQNETEEADNNSDTNNEMDAESQIPDSQKKKSKKKEIDLELLYKTPLSDLHEEASERSSYGRKPQRIQSRLKTVHKPEVKNTLEKSREAVIQHEPYREYNTNCTNPNYQNVPCFNTNNEVSSEYPPAFQTNFKKPSLLSIEGHHREEYPQHSRRPDHYPRRRTDEFEDEKRKELLDRRPSLELQTFGRSNHRNREYSPDQTDYKHRRKSNDYNRWDYAHKKVDVSTKKFLGHVASESSSNDAAWRDSEARDLLEGPVQSTSRPFYRRRQFSRSGGYKTGYQQEEELFERRWDGSEEDRRYRRPFRDRSPHHPRMKRVDTPHGPGRGEEQESPMSPDQESFVYKEPSKYLHIPQ